MRWCLTGTPIHNSLDDYGALLSFIGVTGLSDKPAFDRWIANPLRWNKVNGLQRLQYLVAATAFRRTKAMVKMTVALPKKVEKIELVQLTGADRELYDFFKAKASKSVDQLTGFRQSIAATADNKKENTLSLINVLRLICNHGEHLLPASTINAWRIRQNEQATDDLLFGRQPGQFGLRASDPSDTRTPGSGVFTNDERNIIANTPYPSSDEFTMIPDTASTPFAPYGVRLSPSVKVKALLKNLEREQRTDRAMSYPPVKR